jgi:hypothetical protein
MLKLGFYLPPDSDKQLISQKHLELGEEHENVTKEDILPTDDDYKVFGNQVYVHIDVLMQVCNQIPSLDEARTSLLRAGNSFDLDAQLSEPSVDVVIFPEDLNKKETVQGIINGALNLRE